MNTRILSILEFEAIKQQLSTYVITEQGMNKVEKLLPSSNKEQIQLWLNETKDGLKIQQLCNGIPIPKLVDIHSHMKRLQIGANLNGLELSQIGRILTTTSEVYHFFDELRENEIEFYNLYTWIDQLVILSSLTRQIKVAITEDGAVTDEASPELKNIRQMIHKNERAVREKLEELIRGKNARYLSDSIITMRNERYVIPVKQEHKNTFGGVVHDQSASGQTLFIEPKQIVELNNHLRQLQIAERTEINRILAELSAELAPYYKEILRNAEIIGTLDFINAKADFGKNLKAIVPKINEKNHIFLKQARHPLLDHDKAVSNDITIGEDYQTIVITGPNTGGKTITLKTIGLLQLMGQSGLPIPVNDNSQIGIFKEIFADIGDEQSIEQNLSTFSSHMTNIVSIIEKVDKNSLVLLDELGAGTDPQEGAALAISILDALNTKQAYTIATTHYPELKIYGYNRSGTINASMEFNIDTLSPTYRLLIGVPGRSNAFDISKRLGLNTKIIDEARQIMNGDSQELNEMIADLENRRKMAETEYKEARYFLNEAEQLQTELKEVYRYFHQERENEMEKANKQANSIVKKAQEEADAIIKEIRKMQLNTNQQTTIKEHQLIDAKTKLSNLQQTEEHLEKNKVLKKAKAKKQLNAGDEVIVETYGQHGTLLKKLDKEHWQVQLGILKMPVAEEDLTIVTAVNEQEQRPMPTLRSSKESHVPSQLDVRGKRYEEAMVEVDQYLDSAILAGYSQVTIVHGKGTGALREGITNDLKNHRSVASFAFAPANQGGNGATIVKFK
ncbi:endonuclease MutS2 [Melissococcus plutonius]|uniref:Endonuclease MutS2 n=1 Tax=Melissococcus plutonius TaxID=33970 RepID=A0A2Z5Y2L7_9ENTE|nr:endonuclease MutS2 [Melissococcus plutonius]BAL62190.1 recombination inhibitory protein MutS2 [Melissococcus plutonius DAT561]MCV2497961.1 endonuclease MutS2 [Melissococcus plutonius]MCV2500765.1 endonuclease MutS2 [Melissococcus plutonius]MCV2505302.1 endonuclease MutS2 [Melissococcus plutonius]MCV2506576.1 endonuclease MutS2 [Melissococcus plutonius]